MVRSVKVKLAQAQQTLEMLRQNNWLLEGYKPSKEGEHIYFAITDDAVCPETEDKNLQEIEQVPSLREALEQRLPKEILEEVKTAYDIVGRIAIMEIDRNLNDYKHEIANALLETNPKIQTVVRKQGAHEGELRLQNYEILAGRPTLETTVKENGVNLTLNISKTYYSVRSATERKRIADLVQDEEKVLVMFSGAGPFTCVIGVNTQAKEIVGVELNKDAHKFAEQNIEQNKLINATTYQGDVREVVPQLASKFDRIIMPLPHTAQDFLDTAITAAEKKCMIHLYHFSTEEEVKEFAENKLVERFEELNTTANVKHIEKCGNLGPGIHRWCIDIEIQQE